MRLKFLCLLYLFLFSTTLYATSWPVYSGPHLPQYRVIGAQAHGMVISNDKNELVKGSSKILYGFNFEFSRGRGSWQDYLTDENSYEECVLEQAYKYLKTGHHSSISYSNISNLKFQNKAYKYTEKNYPVVFTYKEHPIPYIEGDYYSPQKGECFFRLYIFSTLQEDSTYFLYVTMRKIDFETKREGFDAVFQWVTPNPRT